MLNKRTFMGLAAGLVLGLAAGPALAQDGAGHTMTISGKIYSVHAAERVIVVSDLSVRVPEGTPIRTAAGYSASFARLRPGQKVRVTLLPVHSNRVQGSATEIQLLR